MKWKAEILRNPWAIAGGVLIGALIGFFFKDVAYFLAPWGELYVRFLEMCIIPIIVTAVVSSIGKLLKSESAGKYTKRIIFFIVGGLFLASCLGSLFAIMGRPGKGLQLNTQVELGKIITKYESKEVFEVVPEKVVTIHKQEMENKEGFFGFITKLVPSNIFSALSEGENVKILFFAIIFGIALGFVPGKMGEELLLNISGLFIALEKIIFFALYLLPFALICLISKQIAETGPTIFNILLKYVILYFSTILIMFFVNLTILWKKLKGSFFYSLKALKESLLIAVGSANIYVAMPSALKGMYEHLKLNKTTVTLILPIGVSIFAFGSTFFYAFNTLFFAQLFNISLSLQGYLIILIGAILASMGSIGAPVLIKITMLSIIFTPLGIPLGPAIAILTAIKPITESFEEAWDLHTNCVLTALIATKQTDTPSEKTEFD